MNFDHVLVIGFGAPTKPEDVKPFLFEVARGRNIPDARIQAVEQHYERIGGRSPYNEQVFGFVERLKEVLRKGAASEPARAKGDDPVLVFVGMRNWHPFLKDTIADIRAKGLKRGVGVVLAPHRSEASFDRYIQSVDRARRQGGTCCTVANSHEINYQYVPPWHDHSLFVEAQAEEINKFLNAMSEKERSVTHVLFTAHSIPVVMAEKSAYAEEIRVSSEQAIQRVGHPHWSIAYQSQSGGGWRYAPAWLWPDAKKEVHGIGARGMKTVLVVPIGFLCENAETLFDLDVELREEAERIGLGYRRARTVMSNENFVRMIAELIKGTVVHDKSVDPKPGDRQKAGPTLAGKP